MNMSEMSINELYQVDAIHAFGLLASAAEARFERLTRLAKRLFNVPVAFVSLADQPWQTRSGKAGKASLAQPPFFTPPGASDELLVLQDTALDQRFSNNPLVGRDSGVRFYVGYPICVGDGEPLGTLCLIDNQPHQFGEDDLALLRDLAKMAEQELFAMELATIDELTRIPNRRGFDAMSEQALSLCQRLGKPVSLLYFDLDLFKQINDQFGHAEGDRALQDFSAILTKSFRQSDIIGRLGGDEFAVMLPNTTRHQALVALRCLEKAVQQHNRSSNRGYKLRFSVGQVDTTVAPANISELMKRADSRMYEHKKQHVRQAGKRLSQLLDLLLATHRKYSH
ncbi:diguanylate cyclase (GGDEF)-like protein [Herbaspirillum sp. Sphag1AN]|uniref:sensor domain-containing diguanylate cyclase n=1 Tax=unclassified Herbaspirillum TaxID=2624150 RepID=UPI00160BEE03|nr:MULTISPECIES: sensor domain-containing diguanylate cyclase [unclassified Herbaspirillum]MBB3212905.1 diguanylate cyclase (GGDEF)-like protein [Herbaspirillum sp. Sphag1AN]MBB3246102.1 diguanylate cyclase (GGDEF)-like protein [Herbaspirillum sp. Sphag64]